MLEIFSKHSASISRRIGSAAKIAAVCDVSPRNVPATYRKVFVADWRKIVADPGIDLVVELIGGYEPAATIILKSLSSGKSVVTANKAVLAARWGDVFSAARRNSKLVYFEAAVGGAIPVVQAINEGLAANRITSISGILNGTSNYMLSAMHTDGISFAAALKNAQAAGFAEADPSCDVKGIDTANKLAILTSIAVGAQVKLRDVSVEGIEGVSAVDVACLKNEFGRVIKLIGKTVIMPDGGVDITVRPRVISPTHPFGNVNWEYNAALISGDSAGDLMFYGKGAGRLPAASAVVSDIIFLSRQIVSKSAGVMPYVEYDPSKKVRILPSSAREGYYYLRFTVSDKPGVLAKIAAALAARGVSIASVYQNEAPSGKNPGGAAIIIITHKSNEAALCSALNAISRLRIVRKKTVVYPMEG